jgi:hypothetical protein
MGLSHSNFRAETGWNAARDGRIDCDEIRVYLNKIGWPDRFSAESFIIVATEVRASAGAAGSGPPNCVR